MLTNLITSLVFLMSAGAADGIPVTVYATGVATRCGFNEEPKDIFKDARFKLMEDAKAQCAAKGLDPVQQYTFMADFYTSWGTMECPLIEQLTLTSSVRCLDFHLPLAPKK